MDYQAGDLRIEGNNYFVQKKKPFVAYSMMLQNDVKDCFDFAYDMSYAKKGAHRDSRSGGQEHRTMGQIFINTFQGKMAEFALYRYLQKYNIEANMPDLAKFKLGKWDSFDLVCQDKHLSVKSTKSYGDLLLLETKDWNNKGEYVPNLPSGNAKYHYTVLVRFKPDGESLLKQKHLLYQKEDEISNNIRQILIDTIYKEKWIYDFPGFIYHSELVKLINERRIIPQNAMLNGGTKMDAENYYFQTGNMHSMNELYMRDVSLVSEDRTSLRLKRMCPKCGKTLVLRKGYSWFWGCEGYFDSIKCEYKEAIEQI